MIRYSKNWLIQSQMGHDLKLLQTIREGNSNHVKCVVHMIVEMTLFETMGCQLYERDLNDKKYYAVEGLVNHASISGDIFYGKGLSRS